MGSDREIQYLTCCTIRTHCTYHTYCTYTLACMFVQKCWQELYGSHARSDLFISDQDWDTQFFIAFVYNWIVCLLCECCLAFAYIQRQTSNSAPNFEFSAKLRIQRQTSNSAPNLKFSAKLEIQCQTWIQRQTSDSAPNSEFSAKIQRQTLTFISYWPDL